MQIAHRHKYDSDDDDPNPGFDLIFIVTATLLFLVTLFR